MDILTLLLAKKYVNERPLPGNIDGGGPGTIYTSFKIDGGEEDGGNHPTAAGK